MTKWHPVMGTEGWSGEPADSAPPLRPWWAAGSTFDLRMQYEGFELDVPDDQFIWSTNTDGWQFWRRWWGKHDVRDERDWLAGAKAYRWWVQWNKVAVADRNVIAHSHGGNLVAVAAHLEGVLFNNVVLIGTPLRADLADSYARLLENSRAVLFVTDKDHDEVQDLGRLGDGYVGKIKNPDGLHVLELKGIGHSSLLYERFEDLVTFGVTRFLARV